MKHRTAQGKMVDMGMLRAKNEKVRAVGNMLVNARGDIIDSHDNVINDSTKRVNEQYMKSVAARHHQTRPAAQPAAQPAPTPQQPPAQAQRPAAPATKQSSASRNRPEVDEDTNVTPPDDIDDDIPNPKK
jgi:hypothetical protein